MSQPRDKSYYLDWIVRSHEEGCLRLGRTMTDDGKSAVREIWDEVAGALESDPKIFRLKRAAAAHVLSEAGELMARSAQMGGFPAVEERHVCAGTIALHELGRGEVLISQDWCEWICPAAAGSLEMRFRPMGQLLDRTRQLQDRNRIRPT